MFDPEPERSAELKECDDGRGIEDAERSELGFGCGEEEAGFEGRPNDFNCVFLVS